MRDAFAYESNGLLLSQLLVPDPIPAQDWSTMERTWRRNKSGLSLMEWIIHRGLMREEELLSVMAAHLQVDWIAEDQQPDGRQSGPDAQLLESQGFRIVGNGNSQRKLVTGGAELAPDLSRFLGRRGEKWEWVLTSPVRENAQGPTPVNAPGEDETYGIQTWLRELIQSEWSEGVSDIHFERTQENLRVRSHHMGKMRLVGDWHDGRASKVTRLLGVLAGFPTARQGLPRDGSLSLGTGADRIELRIASLPTVNGESVVLRSPSINKGKMGLGDLGVPDLLKQELLDAALFDHGLILFTGSTSSGKTTTAYGLLREMEQANLKILTVEDPVEQTIPFAVQSQVDDSNGWTFDQAVRSFLRQDPDLIMIGEIRDRASAEAACRAALTGHAVLATMHAGSSESAIDRLSGWGIPAGTLSETLAIVVNQRLQATGHERTPRALFQWSKFPVRQKGFIER